MPLVNNNVRGDGMTKKITIITLLILLIIVVFLCVISTTYSVITNVINGENNIDITIRDLVTDNDGTFNSIYYVSMSKLDITTDEANIIMDSIPLNKTLNVLINNVFDYSMHNKKKLSNDEIYNLIVDGIYEDDNINMALRDRLIVNVDKHINDIYEYLYTIKKENH